MNARTILRTAVLALLLLVATPAPADDVLDDARLLRFPTIHEDTIVFSHAGDLWSVPAAGGVARRLTTDDGLEILPRFSPDGRWIAFTGQYDGTSDVYVIPAGGGEPRRLTWYPSRPLAERWGADNLVLGWTPDGKVLFRSLRGSVSGASGRPYTVSPEGGPEEPFPLPESGFLSFSPDGRKLAYNRIMRDFRTWKRYMGGMAQDVWIYDLETRGLERITDWKGTDAQPMWIDGSIYFLSDREDWKFNLWRYDLATREFHRVTDFTEHDARWPSAGSGRIVFENGGALYVLDPRDGQIRRVTVRLPDDRRLARPRWVGVADRITSFHLAPGGRRAVFTARGDVFTVPAREGNTRNLTGSPGAREREAAWSPDGKWIAFISDATGEEELYVVAHDGKEPPVQLTRGSASWMFPPVWSPDSGKLAWADRAMRLWYVDIRTRTPVQVDQATVWEIGEYAWSPDSKWIAYVKNLDNQIPTLFLYSLSARSITRVTSGAEQSRSPVFDPGGACLYFLSDRDVNPVLGNFELSFTVGRMTRPYAVVLRADAASPFAPRSDEAKVAEPGKAEAKADAKPAEEKKEPFRIDLEGIETRIVGFPVPPGEYASLRAAAGRVYWLSLPVAGLAELESEAGLKGTLVVFDLEKRESQELLAGIQGYALAPDGSRLLYRAEETFGIVDAAGPAKADDGKLDLSGLKLALDPKAEWAQIFRETWRLQRDFFYLPDLGGVDWPAVRARYEPLVAHVSHRFDLTYLLGEMIAELGTSHAYVGGGDAPRNPPVPVGLLGADLLLDAKAGRWRIERILRGQNWMESRRSPLTEPGVHVAEGDYLLAVDGRPLTGSDNPYAAFVQTTGRTVRLLVNSKPTPEGAREILVKPIGSETDLRYFNWVEDNRQKVDRATGGRVGYIHIPNMGTQGLQEFVRQYFPQIRRDGLIVDVRYNGGGFVSEMILERLRRIVIGMGAARDAGVATYPTAAFHGPMVALLNPYSASDGDIFPFYFREYGLGPLIGRRSWGGVVGIRGFVSGGLADGGYVTMPEFGTYDMKSRWIIENAGVEPDIEVDNPPAEELAGRDAQLERAIEEILRALEGRTPGLPARPASLDLNDPRGWALGR